MFVTELMLLGFISLLLTVFQGLVSHICIPTDLVSIMLPCKRETPEAKHHGDYTSSQAIYNIHRRLLSEDSSSSGHCVKKVKCMTWIFELHMDNSVFWNLNNKQLSFNLWKVTVEGKKSRLILFFFFCTIQGKAPLLSLEALHHLHIFIFVLAVVHVIFCVTTMVLGGMRVIFFFPAISLAQYIFC